MSEVAADGEGTDDTPRAPDHCRVLLSKVGLDGHEVGVLLVAKKLADAGFEVIYLGKRTSTEQIVRTAIQEDAAVIGVSCLSGGLGHFTRALVRRLSEEQVDIPVLAGGIDEPGEIASMLKAGVSGYFGPGAGSAEIVAAFVEVAQRAPLV